jgi:protein tyrosine phosphatase (PTP) superfamily phosphohydrolase (DUF442 family)
MKIYRPTLTAIFLSAAIAAVTLLLGFGNSLRAQQSRAPLEQSFAPREKIAAPIVLCIDDKPEGGGQPSAQAYAKAAANGFRSILTLRSAADGVDLIAERFMVEQNKLRYFNIPAGSKLPSRERVDEYLRVAGDQANHPMLINCAFAERVAPLMMIFRIVEQGWSQEKALKEATASGLKAGPLQKFTAAYLAQRKTKPNAAVTTTTGKPIKNSN